MQALTGFYMALQRSTQTEDATEPFCQDMHDKSSLSGNVGRS